MAAKPLYQQIKEALADQIDKRVLLPGQQLPTELELANQYGVSRITSKRALTELEKEGYITRQRGKGSFVASSFAKNHAGLINKVISIVFPNFNSQNWAMAYVKGAMNYLNPRGYFLSIHGTGELDDRALLNQLVKDGVGGIIYYPDYTTQCTDILTSIALNRIPLVTIDKTYDGLPISSITSDNYRGGYLATEHLLLLGHRHVAFVSSCLIGERTSVRDRFCGYCHALLDHGIMVDPDLIFDDYFRSLRRFRDAEEGRSWLRNRLQQLVGSHTTAILAENDYESLFLYQLIRDMGLKIPEDLSLVGYDNSELLDRKNISMTTINQHFHQIGIKAATVITTLMENPEGEPQHIKLPVELILGETTGPPRQI
ncbi:MAG: substrate-binding domain-containing protein [Clostridia bacterium]|nr:substrate-binding domain-containing protein [Clostridia bacterium]